MRRVVLIAVRVRGIIHTSTRDETFYLCNLPLAHPTKRKSTPSLPLPVTLNSHTSAIPAIEARDCEDLRLHAWPSKVLHRNIAPPDIAIRLKRDMVPLRTLQSIQREDIQVIRSSAATLRIPMCACLLEREAYARAWLLAKLYLAACRLEARLRESFLGNKPGIEVSTTAVLVAKNVLLPCDRSTIVAELLTAVSGIVIQAEVFVRLGKPLWRKAFLVRLVGAIHCTGTPTTIDELPLPSVNLDDIPSVSGVVRGNGIARFELGVSKTLSMAGDDIRLESSLHGQSCKESSVTLTDCKSRLQSRLGCRRLEVIAEEGNSVICDIVM